MYVNMKKIISILLSTIYLIFLVYLEKQLHVYEISKWLDYTTIIIIATIIFQIFILRLVDVKIISIPVTFIILTYLFHFSQVLLLSIEYDFGNLSYSIAMDRYGINSFKEVINLCIYSTYFVYLGILVSSFKRNKYFNIKSNNMNFTDRKKIILGIIFVLISFPTEILFNFIPQLTAMLTGGYTSVHEVGGNIIIRCVSYLLFPGIYLLITSKLISKSTSKGILFIFIIYKIISMITGLRAYNLVNIMLMIYLYNKTNNSINIKQSKIILLGIMSIPMTNLLNIIRENRISGLNFEVIFSNIFNLSNNIYLSIMSEFGITINVVNHVFNNLTEYKKGGQIITGILSIIPGISSLLPYIEWKNLNIAENFGIQTLGGSYIADFYFDFGYGCIIACFIYGYLIFRLSNYVDNCIKTKKYEKVAFISPLIIELMFTIRSSIYKIPRTIFIYTIIYFIIKLYIYIMSSKKGGLKIEKNT